MNRTPGTPERIDRLRAIHRKMKYVTFQRNVPVRAGWKREYFDGMAHVRPSRTMVRFLLTLAPRTVPRAPGLRFLKPDDATPLHDAFLDAFRAAPDYASFPMAQYRKRAAEYLRGFWGTVRGPWSPASAVIAREGRVLAAALVKEAENEPPLLDCLLVRPESFRQGLATAVMEKAVHRLHAAGHRELSSYVMLANEPSLAWHTAFGFREVPDLFLAQLRCQAAQSERERQSELGLLTETEANRLNALEAHWWAEAQRLSDRPRK